MSVNRNDFLLSLAPVFLRLRKIYCLSKEDLIPEEGVIAKTAQCFFQGSARRQRITSCSRKSSADA